MISEQLSSVLTGRAFKMQILKKNAVVQKLRFRPVKKALELRAQVRKIKILPSTLISHYNFGVLVVAGTLIMTMKILSCGPLLNSF